MHLTSIDFGHQNIIAFCDRPFENAQEMDEVMIANWNKVVKPQDTIWVPGDLCMGKIDKTIQYIKRLNGTIILIPGNHDKCWFGRSAGETLGKWRQAYLDAGISQIIDTGAGHPEPTIQLGNVEAKISHFPYRGDSHDKGYEDKYSAWRPDDEGGWLIHGHIHNNESDSPRNGRMLNVSVDVWGFTPAHIDQLRELVEAA